MANRLGFYIFLVVFGVGLTGCVNTDSFDQGDAGSGDGFRCTDGQYTCMGSRLLVCKNGKDTTVKTCAKNKVCDAQRKDCLDCDTGYQHTCMDGNVHVCNKNGTIGAPVKQCPNKACQAGVCIDPCSTAERKRSYLGCTYWPTVTSNSGLVRDFQFALAVANPNPTAVTVTVASGTNPTLATRAIAADSVATIKLPWVMDLKGTRTTRRSRIAAGSYKLTSTQPVTVYQFNPLNYELPYECKIDKDSTPNDGKCNSYTNDASLLLPEHTQGTQYIVVARPTMMIGAGSQYITNPGFFSVVASQWGETKVTIKFSANTKAGVGAVGTYRKGQVATFTLKQWNVLQILSEEPSSCSPKKTDARGYKYCDLSATADLTGTEITADKKVAVFSGHDCTFIPFDKWACDHLEEQLFPVVSWGKHYIGTHTKSSGTDPNVYRLVSAADNNTITFLALSRPQAKLNRGQWVEFETNEDFEVKGSEAFLMTQFMVGQGYSNSSPGAGAPNDPAMSLAVPTEQYRRDYRFLAPSSYKQNYVNIIAPKEATVDLDGKTIPNNEWTPIGKVDSSNWKVAKKAIPGGSHTIQGTRDVGISVYGVGSYTSYMYPGGLDLKELIK